MPRVLCCVAALLLLAAPAAADEADCPERPGQLTIRLPAPQVEVGVAAGKVFQTDLDGDAIALRAGLRSGRLGAGLELGKREVADQYVDRIAGAALSLDLGGGRLIPRALAGAGIGRVAQMWAETSDYAWAYVGGGAALRLSPRVTAGAELRFGTRQILRTQPGDYVILRTDEPQLVPPDGETLIYRPPFPRDYAELQVGLTIQL